MASNLPLSQLARSPWAVAHERLELRTQEPQQFIDVTEWVAQRVRRAGVADGSVTVQSLHTTAAVVVNENEPLLLHDLTNVLAHWAPAHGGYRHDELAARAATTAPDERPKAHAHAHPRAMALQISVTLALVDGAVQLGRWQRIFLVELDGPRPRTLSSTVMGLVNQPPPRPSLLRPADPRTVADSS